MRDFFEVQDYNMQKKCKITTCNKDIFWSIHLTLNLRRKLKETECVRYTPLECTNRADQQAIDRHTRIQHARKFWCL